MTLKPLRTGQPATRGGPPLDTELYRHLEALRREALDKPRLSVVPVTLRASELTDGGGAVGTKNLGVAVPAGARFLFATATNIVGFTGDVSAVLTLGDGSDVDRYNTGTPSVFTTASQGVDMGVPSGTAWHTTAVASVVATVTSSADITLVIAGTGSVDLQFWFLEPI